MLLARILEKTFKIGRLTLIDGNGRTHVIQGDRPGPACTIKIHDRALHWKLIANPKLAFGEAIMDGTLTCEDTAEWHRCTDAVRHVAVNASTLAGPCTTSADTVRRAC